MGAQPILCRTPAPGRKPTRIDPWTFVRIRGLIKAVLANHPDGIPPSELPQLIRNQMSCEEASGYEELADVATVVRHEMEVRGEIRRRGETICPPRTGSGWDEGEQR